MECIIVYDIPQRELQNAYALKAELEKRGHDAYICRLSKIMKGNLDFNPDVVLFPYLYGTYIVNTFLSKFKNKIPRIVNLQYEQILSKKREEIGTHNPTGTAVDAMHLCWGVETRERLVKNKVPKENAPVVGCINIDMDLERFESMYRTKKEIGQKFNIDSNKKWVLFISSFTNNTDEIFFGKENTEVFQNIIQQSRKDILGWIEKYIQDDDCEFIYRPHPGEKMDKVLSNLVEKYKNFHVEKEDSVRSWIKVCDKINTWISTSIVDAYYMKKDCSILRPVYIPKDFDIVIMTEADCITKYEDFYKYNKNNDLDYVFPVDKEVLARYYDVDENKYAYERICDLLEHIVDNNINMNLYK